MHCGLCVNGELQQKRFLCIFGGGGGVKQGRIMQGQCESGE